MVSGNWLPFGGSVRLDSNDPGTSPEVDAYKFGPFEHNGIGNREVKNPLNSKTFNNQLDFPLFSPIHSRGIIAALYQQIFYLPNPFPSPAGLFAQSKGVGLAQIPKNEFGPEMR